MPLRQLADYRPLKEQRAEYDIDLLNQAFSIHPSSPASDGNYAFYKRTEIWRSLRKAKDVLLALRKEQKNELIVQDEAGRFYVEFRRYRQNAVRIRDTLPDLSAALNEYIYITSMRLSIRPRKAIRRLF